MGYAELTAKFVKCRKPHICEWCAGRVEKGERAFYRAYIFEGDFKDGHMHEDCKVGMDKTNANILMEGWQPSEFKRGEFLTEDYR